MAGIGKYKKGVAFTLKSGNKPSFTQMGSGLSTPLLAGTEETPKEKIDKEAEVKTIEQKMDEQIGVGSELDKDLTGTFAEFTSDGKIITSDDPRHSSNITKKKSFQG